MKTSFIGAGKMAEAMIAAMIGSKTLGPHEIFASDIDKDRRDHLKKAYGINVYSNNHVAVGSGQVVFLSVKPQNLEEVLKEIAPDLTRKHLVISIAAGRKISTIEGALKGMRVIRVMPNIACLAGEGMSVFCAGSRVTVEDKKTASSLLACFGKTLELPEEQLDAVTALSGSGPAFLAFLADCMVEAGVEEGLARKHALLLIEQTMLGTAKLLIERDMEPADLIKAVTSAKGTTAAGLQALDRAALVRAVKGAIKAAASRSRELSA